MSSNGTANTTAAPAPSSPAAAQSNPPSSADPPSSPAPAPSSAAPAPSSSPPPAQSSAAPPAQSSAAPPAQSSAAPPATSKAPAASDTTKTVTASSAPPSLTQVQTSTITITPTPSVAGETPSVVVITSIITPTNQPTQAAKSDVSASSTPSSADGAGLQGARAQNSSGLSTGGKTAVAVVVPVVVVALLVLGAILFWRRRKQQKNNEDERRKEVEEYGYNPNHDPTLPAVGAHSEMAEDSSGYRGWGNTATSSGRKASTTLTSGMTYSDSTSNPGGYQSPHSPTHGAYSDANSNDPLVNGRRETLDADGIAALGAAPHATSNQAGVARGPSNASSSYSAANHSDNSGEYPGMHMNNPQEYYDQGYGSYQDGPYGGPTAYGGGQQPVIRDVSARRNTRIENPSVFPQGNSGVATNF